MICKFTCTECHISFYWTPIGDASLCVQCPGCHKDYQFYKNKDLAIEPMEESE